MSPLAAVDAADRWQRRHPVAGFPVAVLKRYGEDHGGWLGGIVTYYGFFALAPLLAVVMTVLTVVFEDEPSRRDQLLAAIREVLPFVGQDMQQSLAPIVGNPFAVVVGVIVALWGGINAVRVAQDTMNRMWGVPRYRRPGFARAAARGAIVVALLGAGLVVTAVITGITLGHRLPLLTALGTGVVTCVANTAIAMGLFRLLVARRLTLRELLPGAVLVGIGSYVLTLAGGLYVQHVVAGASSLYGSFATMVGLFAWIALLVQTVVYGTLVDVVRVERLWPRSLTGRDLDAGDRRAADLTASRAALRAAVPSDDL
jgi:YihY family inner membrane protein